MTGSIKVSPVISEVIEKEYKELLYGESMYAEGFVDGVDYILEKLDIKIKGINTDEN